MMFFVYIFAAFIRFTVGGMIEGQIRLSRHRGISRDAFIAEFQELNIPPERPAAVFDHYKSFCKHKDYSVAPDDSFEKVFRIDHECIDEDVERLAEKLGIEFPIESVLRQWTTPPRTLRDMVPWLDWVRQHPQ